MSAHRGLVLGRRLRAPATVSRWTHDRSRGVQLTARAALEAKLSEDNTLTIGKTPLVQLNRIPFGAHTKRVLAKVEARNPAFSVKCRTGAAMVWDAEARGLLQPGMTIVEPTSGNTGIALAFVAAARGYECLLTIPESMSTERRKLMKAFGARLLLTDAAAGMRGAILAAEELCKRDATRYYMPQQFKNPANPLIHELTTGPEIDAEAGGDVDVIVSGVGTGGTLTGVGRYFKSKGKAVHMVAVEPTHSPVITQQRQGLPLTPNPHKIQGIGAGFIPDTLDLSLVDEVRTVHQDNAILMARRLAQEEGILVGISCGAAAHVAIELAHEERFRGKTIVVVLPDSGERYLSTPLYDTDAYKSLELSRASDRIL
eukprot:TRINITY_DN2221_c0_g1_i1.p2 TRINITY_DN2221_c0_g1~~TRINITY_DN2221_c0_g1_i1.p2  ORF type:complete len:371 (+),score=135.47 TRINITY_DN2221_c0_g1_i1:3-1115(+)